MNIRLYFLAFSLIAFGVTRITETRVKVKKCETKAENKD